MTDHNDATTTFGPLPSRPPDPADRVGEVLDSRFVLLERVILGFNVFGPKSSAQRVLAYSTIILLSFIYDER